MAKKRRLKENGALSGTAGPHPGGKPLSPLKGTRAGASSAPGTRRSLVRLRTVGRAIAPRLRVS